MSSSTSSADDLDALLMPPPPKRPNCRGTTTTAAPPPAGIALEPSAEPQDVAGCTGGYPTVEISYDVHSDDAGGVVCRQRQQQRQHQMQIQVQMQQPQPQCDTTATGGGEPSLHGDDDQLEEEMGGGAGGHHHHHLPPADCYDDRRSDADDAGDDDGSYREGLSGDEHMSDDDRGDEHLGDGGNDGAPPADDGDTSDAGGDAADDNVASVATTTTTAEGVGRRRPNKRPPRMVPTRFVDVIGHGAAKLRLDEALLPLALPPSLADSVLTGVRASPASILLHGPPGCGKTKLARAVAGEAQAALLSVGPSDVLSKFVGESEAAVRGLFREAREMAREVESRCTVIFFDEIDALGQSRGGAGRGGVEDGGGGGQESGGRRLLAELLIQMSRLSNGDCSSDEEEASDDDDTGLEDKAAVGDTEGDVGGDRKRRRPRPISPMPPAADVLGTRESKERSYLGKDFELRAQSPEVPLSSPPLCQGSPSLFRTASTAGNGRPLARRPKPRVIVVAATNRPEDCDPALLRRFAVRVLVDVPTRHDRRRIIRRLLSNIENSITPPQLEELANATDGWSGSELESLTREAAMAPVRERLREAAVLKARARKREQQSGADSSQEQEKYSAADADSAARESLLNGFRNLRPVSLTDFENAVAFWMGDQQGGIGGFVQQHPHSHYDSCSSDEEGF